MLERFLQARRLENINASYFDLFWSVLVYLGAQKAGKTGKGAIARTSQIKDEIDNDALRVRLQRVEEWVDLDGARLSLAWIVRSEKTKCKQIHV